MERILLIIDAENLSMHALDFTCFLARLTRSRVTGVFLENLAEEKKVLLSAAHTAPYVAPGIPENEEEATRKRNAVDGNISLFKNACENREVSCSVIRDAGIPLKETIHESRFADLVVIDPATSFRKNYEGTPTDFVKEILERAECPVIVAPESFDELSEIIFTYDGSRSAAFAIKQFSYLFPQLSDKRVIVIHANESGEWPEKDKHNLTELLKNRYSAIGFQALKGNPETALFNFLFKRKNSIVVMGAYGRSHFSRFLHESRADLIIKTMPLPLFIAHY